jgi:TM2 domain-containing membrane protein YozV
MANITESKADMYLTANAKCFQSFQIAQIRERLLNMDESKWVMIQSIPLKDPQTSLLLSIFLGAYGVDRFYIGHTGMGVGKLLTCGGLGIWTIIDWFQIQSSTRIANFEKIQPYLY